ncbi:MAG: hypothetical protein AAF730_17740 [Bacteroidota bacterium]
MHRTALDLTPKNILLIISLSAVFMLGLSFFLPESMGWLGWTVAFAASSTLGIAFWAIYRHATIGKPRRRPARTPQQRRAVAEWYRNHNEQPIAREDVTWARQPRAAAD